MRRTRGRRATAERTGGVWETLPTNWDAAFLTAPSSRSSCRRRTAAYSLPAERSAETAFVAPLTVTGRAPVTLGSRVPPWPTSSTPRALRSQAATWWLVGPDGLSSGTTPAARISATVRSCGRLPYLGSVSAWMRTRRLRRRGRLHAAATCGRAFNVRFPPPPASDGLSRAPPFLRHARPHPWRRPPPVCDRPGRRRARAGRRGRLVPMQPGVDRFQPQPSRRPHLPAGRPERDHRRAGHRLHHHPPLLTADRKSVV